MTKQLAIEKNREHIIKLFLHLLVWLFVWAVIRYFSVPTLTKDNNPVIIHASFVVFIQSIFIFYFSGYFILPKLLFEKQYVLVCASIFSLFQVIYIVNYYEFSYLVQISDAYKTPTSLYVKRVWDQYLYPYPWTGCFTQFSIAYFNYAWSFFYITPLLAVKVMRDLIKFQTRNLTLERDRLQLDTDNLNLKNQTLHLQRDNIALELSFLRSQINPHFLFNILNNIYTKIFDVDEQAAELVIKLSDLMRYSLYECNKEKVVLQQEVDYIKNYIDLEKARRPSDLDIVFETSGDLSMYQISPLLMISFIENAFKHGINPSKRYGYIKAVLHIHHGQLFFKVKNSIPDEFERIALGQDVKKSGGFGLSNTYNRLNLLYPNRHSVVISHDETSYTAELHIQVSEKSTSVDNHV